MTITLDAPDLGLARARQSAAAVNGSGIAVPPVSEYRRALAAGEVDETSVQLTRPLPGYYRLYLTATSSDPTERDAEGRPVQNMAVLESWLFVTADRVLLTATFEAARLGDSLQHAPGAFARRRLPKAKQPSASLSEGQAVTTRGLVASSSTIDRQKIRLVYWNLDSVPHQYAPVVGAYVNVREYNDYYQTDTWWGVLTTDANGEVSIPCPYLSDSTFYYWDARGENGDVVVTGGFTASSTTLGGCTEDTQVMAVGNDATARVFSNFRTFVPLTRTLFGHTRSRVPVEILGNITISAYTASSDQIRIVGAGGNAAVWGSYGRYAQTHEYGHSLHEKAFGGIYRLGSCPSPHYNGLYYNLGCAWVEGFATYISWAVWTTKIDDVFYAPGDNNTFRNASLHGTIAEADVASFLYDLTDPSNESFDTVAMPGSYLRALTRDCRYQGSAGFRPDGLDILLACLERAQFDASTSYTFFNDRPLPPNGVYPNTADVGGTTAAQIRTLWRWNLFSL